VLHLYRINTKFLGKDLEEKAILGYVAAENVDQVIDHIRNSRDETWADTWYPKGGWKKDDQKRADYIANQGDFHTEYDGEFYDQKYGWNDLGEITPEQVETLKKLVDLKLELTEGR
jgi:hypothetical protein